MISAEQSHFNNRAEDYETDIGADYPQTLKWQLIKKYTDENDMVVDVGGANGRHAVDLAQAGRKVTCIDLSLGMLNKMRRRKSFLALEDHLKPKPIVAKAQSLPLASNSVDLAYCYATLLLIPDQEKAVTELARIVRPGGHVIVDIARPWNLGWIYWRHHYKKLGFPGIFPLNIKTTQKLFSDLSCVAVETIATGVLTQLLYIPFLEKKTSLRHWIHNVHETPDLDGKITAKFPKLANREYIVLRKDNRL